MRNHHFCVIALLFSLPFVGFADVSTDAWLEYIYDSVNDNLTQNTRTAQYTSELLDSFDEHRDYIEQDYTPQVLQYLDDLSFQFYGTFGNPPAGTARPWLQQFLIGNLSADPVTASPQFRVLTQGLASGSSQTYVPRPNDNNNGQNLTAFLSYTLGGMYLVNPRNSQGLIPSNDNWASWWGSNAWFRGVTSNQSEDGRGYNFWTVWMAEGMRRQVDRLDRLVETNTWSLLNPETNVMQGVASLSDPTVLQQRQNDFSNAVVELDDFIVATTNSIPSELAQAEGDSKAEYDNSEGDTDYNIGPTSGSITSGTPITLATATQMSEITSQVGIRSPGPIQWTPSNNQAVTDGVQSIRGLMVSVWVWIRSLLIVGIVIYWWRRCRAYVFFVGMRNHGGSL